MGYHDIIQKGVGRGLKMVHRQGGFKVSYTLCKDLTAGDMDPTVLIIYMDPTPQVKQRERSGGRDRVIFASGANLSAEALPVFVVSRESLKIAGVYYEPTEHDQFVEYGKTSPIFRVSKITSITSKAAGWMLTCTAIFEQSAGV